MSRLITRSPDILGSVKEIPWTPSRTMRSNGKWPYAKEIRIGHDWYVEKYEILAQAPEGSVIIDAGCKTGDWVHEVRNDPHRIISADVIYIAVDPINYHLGGLPHYYYQCAIDNVDTPSEMTFKLFDEPGCNSLLNKSEHLTMRNVVGTITVPVRTLESIVLEKVPAQTTVHYIKCDCQGKDVEVVKSLRSFLPYTNYIQVECSFDKTKPFYENQPSYEEDVEELAKFGFEPLYFIDYLESPLPEGEIVFKRKGI